MQRSASKLQFQYCVSCFNSDVHFHSLTCLFSLLNTQRTVHFLHAVLFFVILSFFKGVDRRETYINRGEVLHEIKHPRMRRNCNRSRTPEHKHTYTSLMGVALFGRGLLIGFLKFPLFILVKGVSDYFFQIITTKKISSHHQYDMWLKNSEFEHETKCATHTNLRTT